MQANTDDPWSVTGLDPMAGKVLEHLVTVPSADVTEVAAALGVSPAEADRVLGHLAASALVLKTDAAPPRWAAGPPRSSLGALLARRRAELDRAESMVARLHEVYEVVSAPRAGHLVEVLQSAGEVSVRYGQLLKASTGELLHFSKPPYVTGLTVTPEDLGLPPAVRMRSVYETDGFTDVRSLATAVYGTRQGGELRLAARLPVKLAVFDRSAALLPVREEEPSSGSMVVHSPALVTALVELFENVWERAEPVSLESLGEGPVPGGEPALSGPDLRTREILHLMATGMKDETIARVLRVSRRTVQKHVSYVGAALGARTRFQIALMAAERGWLKQGA
ncbi:helix-turn-helix transcriptional regulator [Streptomyces sp. NPDC054847]